MTYEDRLENTRHIIQKEKQLEDIRKQIDVLDRQARRLSIELELLSAHYSAESAPEEFKH